MIHKKLPAINIVVKAIIIMNLLKSPAIVISTFDIDEIFGRIPTIINSLIAKQKLKIINVVTGNVNFFHK